METRWLYTTVKDFPALREAAKETCVIPVGCVEKHSLHLPLGQDIIQVSHLAYQASQIEPVCVFADFAFGDVPGAHPAGSIGLPFTTQFLLLEQLCDVIGQSGFKKILLYNGHGGNSCFLNQFMRDIERKKKPYTVVYCMIKLWAPHPMAQILLEQGSGSIPELTPEDEALLLKYHEENMTLGHAGMDETAYMMGISPESVKMEYVGIESGLDQNKTGYLKEAGLSIVDGGWGINYPNEFCGHDPIGCNERIGRASVRLEAERLANAYKVLKEDENIYAWYQERQAKLK